MNALIPSRTDRDDETPLHIVRLAGVPLPRTDATHGVSFLQVPAWAGVKVGWRPELIGWQESRSGTPGAVQGHGLVLHRPLPVVRRSLAYLAEGPHLPWGRVAQEPDRWLDPLVRHASAGGAFALRIGPPVPLRRWSPSTIKRGLADAAVARFADLPPDRMDAAGATLVSALRERGWRPIGTGDGFDSGQPRYVAQVPLAGRSEDELWQSLNQQWRRNVTAARKAGVRVSVAGPGESAQALEAFHTLYAETAARDGFTGRPRSYFERLLAALDGSPAQARIHLARWRDEPLAAALVITVERHAWYVYGASTSRHREVRASNAVQWHALTCAVADGCDVYDLRGVAAGLDPAQRITGLQQFKVGMGATTVEYVGEWELPLSRPLYALYRRRMGGH